MIINNINNLLNNNNKEVKKSKNTHEVNEINNITNYAKKNNKNNQNISTEKILANNLSVNNNNDTKFEEKIDFDIENSQRDEEVNSDKNSNKGELNIKDTIITDEYASIIDEIYNIINSKLYNLNDKLIKIKEKVGYIKFPEYFCYYPGNNFYKDKYLYLLSALISNNIRIFPNNIEFEDDIIKMNNKKRRFRNSIINYK